jgi:UDP-3-O-[3-hydroxymyristoyl] glucosamine N-acyltransferase
MAYNVITQELEHRMSHLLNSIQRQQNNLKSEFAVLQTNFYAIKPNSYTHDQAVPAATWTIKHNLGYHPNVTVVDSSDRVVIGDVTYVDENTVIATFAASFGGKAYLS